MGFFAIVRQLKPPLFKIRKLDINLWCLPGLFGRSLLLCDIGLSIEATEEGGLESFLVAMPFGTADDELVDLVPRLLNRQADLNLLFGNAAVLQQQAGNRTYDAGSGPEILMSLDLKKSNKNRRVEGSSFSLWEIHLERPLLLNEKAYVRMRLPVRSPGRMWTWNRMGHRRGGVLLDMRINELRETIQVSANLDWAQRIVNVEKVNCVVVVPAAFQSYDKAPEPHYVRILEGLVWEPYLDRAINLFRPSKVVVYFWKSERAVTQEDEFRCFAAFNRPRKPPVLRVSLAAAFFAGLITLLAQDRQQMRQSYLFSMLSGFWDFTARHLLLISGAGVAVGLLKFSGPIFRWLPLVKRLPTWLRRTELKIYRSRRYKGG